MARILIVEDEDSIREVMVLAFALRGHVTEEAADGLAGLDRLRSEEFDLVISDVEMPHLTGPEMFQAANPLLKGRTARLLEVDGMQRTEFADGVGMGEFPFDGLFDHSVDVSSGWAEQVNRALRDREALLDRAHRQCVYSPHGSHGRDAEPWERFKRDPSVEGEVCAPVLSTSGRDAPPADRGRVERALSTYCRARGLPTQRVEWVGSPLEGCRIVALATPGRNDGTTLRDALRDSTVRTLRNEGIDRGLHVPRCLSAQLYQALRRFSVASRAGCYLAALRGIDAQDGPWQSSADGASPEDDLGAVLVEEAGWVWLFDDGFAVVSERHGPVSTRSDGRLHHESEACLQYPDGFGLWALSGFLVPRAYVEEPRQIRIADIRKTRNAELRRILRERYGEDRYEQNLTAAIVDVDTVPVDALAPRGQHITRALVDDVEGKRYLVASDGSTARVYHMRVPSTCMTCREAYEALSGKSSVRTIVEA